MPVRLFSDLAKTAQVVKMPVLADGRVNFVGQPVLAFAV
jgi:xanthine dehydrogenase molybdopterin-binding subunit B